MIRGRVHKATSELGDFRALFSASKNLNLYHLINFIQRRMCGNLNILVKYAGFEFKPSPMVRA